MPERSELRINLLNNERNVMLLPLSAGAVDRIIKNTYSGIDLNSVEGQAFEKFAEENQASITFRKNAIDDMFGDGKLRAWQERTFYEARAAWDNPGYENAYRRIEAFTERLEDHHTIAIPPFVKSDRFSREQAEATVAESLWNLKNAIKEANDRQPPQPTAPAPVSSQTERIPRSEFKLMDWELF